MDFSVCPYCSRIRIYVGRTFLTNLNVSCDVYWEGIDRFVDGRKDRTVTLFDIWLASRMFGVKRGHNSRDGLQAGSGPNFDWLASISGNISKNMNNAGCWCFLWKFSTILFWRYTRRNYGISGTFIWFHIVRDNCRKFYWSIYYTYAVAPPMYMLPSKGPNSSSGSKSTIW